jgi:3-mercaptopyruvate sulfurtransferase SseA/acetyl esterase/lipase
MKHIAATIALVSFTVPALGQDQAKETLKSFTYKTTKQAKLEMQVHFPPDWKKEDRRPAIVFFFGGGWAGGSVKQFEPQAAYLATRGMVAARADYRVKSRHEVSPDACVEDAKSAVRWLRQHADTLGIDPDRIVASGGSAGGHIAACTACPGFDAEGEDQKISSRPNALLLFNPVLRFDGSPELMRRIGNDEKLGKALSPTLHLAKDTPPALLFFGKKDGLLKQGEEYMARSKEVGHKADMFLAEAVGHGFFNASPWRERTLRRADEFLGSLGYLKGEPTIKDSGKAKEPQTMLIQPAELEKGLGTLRLLDTRPHAEYAKGHLPGAVWVDVKSWQALGKKEGGFHDARAWAEKVRQFGIAAGTQVVVYGSAPTDTARIWWTLKYLGLEHVAILDGGWQLWTNQNRRTDAVEPAIGVVKFEPKFQADRLEEMDSLKKSVRAGSVTVVDTRSTDEYTGKEVRGKRGGHIPGSKHLEWKELLAADGRYKTPEQLRALFKERGIQPEQTAVTC